jgi:hypothetical protein
LRGGKISNTISGRSPFSFLSYYMMQLFYKALYLQIQNLIDFQDEENNSVTGCNSFSWIFCYAGQCPE